MLPYITILEIVGNPNDIVATYAGPDEKTGKFCGWITRGPGHNYKPLFNTSPLFENAKEAEDCMKEMVQFVNSGDEAEFAKPENWPIFQYLPKDFQEKLLEAQQKTACPQ